MEGGRGESAEGDGQAQMEGGVKQKECKRLDGALKCDGIIGEWRQGTAVKEERRQERFDLQAVEGVYRTAFYYVFLSILTEKSISDQN